MKQLKTRWTEQINPEHVWEEYPRPLMKRESYVNLNGYWEYAITKEKSRPKEYEGEILVPFSPETLLSGVQRQLKPKEYLWYHRTFPEEVKKKTGKRWLLHFGAVDQYAVVYVNGHCVTKHLGGYLPFTADVTDYLKKEENELVVRVQDYSDASYYSKGKQKLNRGGMFYTAQSGIWQTVWMEEVPKNHITDVITTPLYDEKCLQVEVCTIRPADVRVVVWSDETQPQEVEGKSGKKIRIPMTDMHSWSPENPYLYQMKVVMEKDEVESYAAMRKISVEQDQNGIPRMFLNNQEYFQNGVLDQGYWPDGLYTAPCDEAFIYDIQTMKDLGYNMLRKHIKIEPQRWYYHCDRLGMLVWQDMVNGGTAYKHWFVTYMATALQFLHIGVKDVCLGLLSRRDERGRKQFVQEMRETMRVLYSHPSIVTWVIFNEGWGQFHANRVTQIAREIDNTRLLDQASGWFDQGGGDIKSIHEYFFPLRIKAEERRAAALTEFGGYSLPVKGHRMFGKIYGYRVYAKKEELEKGYKELWEREIEPNIKKGLSATVYTQLSDVEEEINGIITYDREEIKFGDGGK